MFNSEATATHPMGVGERTCPQARRVVRPDGMLEDRGDPGLVQCRCIAWICAVAMAGGSSLALASAAAASFPGRDGNIAFASNRSGLFDLYAMTPSGRLVKQLTRTRAVHELQPAWSADGRRIAFTRRSFADENHPGPFEIWVMNANGSHPHRLARGTEPAWSPDGRRIAFTGSYTPRVSHPDIWVMRSDGSHLRRLTFNRLATDRSPDWSPDGRQIAFVTNRGFHGTRAIYVMHPDGHQKLRLTPTGVRTDSRVGPRTDGRSRSCAGPHKRLWDCPRRRRCGR